MQVTVLLVTLCSTATVAFRPMSHLREIRSQRSALSMSDLVLAANPTAEEWLDVAEPGLKRSMVSRVNVIIFVIE